VGIIVWVDEVQTFGRTGELFATTRLDLADYVDVVTIGKILQGSATLYRKNLAPDRGLASGTFSGATVAMAVGRRIVEKLTGEGFFGPRGRELELERLTREHLERLGRKYPGAISEIDGVGAMLAFRLGDGSLKRPARSSGAASTKDSHSTTAAMKPLAFDSSCRRAALPRMN